MVQSHLRIIETYVFRVKILEKILTRTVLFKPEQLTTVLNKRMNSVRTTYDRRTGSEY